MKELFSKNKKGLEQFRSDAVNKFPEEEKESLWIRIERSIDKGGKKTGILNLYYWVAASICLLVISGGIFFINKSFQEDMLTENITTPVTESIIKSPETVKLIAVDGSEIVFEGEEPEIIAQNYADDTGKDLQNSPRFNQLIVPSGKKSYLILEDGTKLWVNSDTKVTYPEKFGKDKRVITVDGEIYAEVAKEKDRPFIAQTQSLQVQVLGTEFNLNAYNADIKQSVILVSGKVEISPEGFEPVILHPNSMLSVVNNNLELKKDIDIYNYICWKDNLLVLDAISFAELIHKLNRYYDCDIITNGNFDNRILSGKLDLKNSLEDVIKSLSISLNYSYEIKNNQVIIYLK